MPQTPAYLGPLLARSIVYDPDTAMQCNDASRTLPSCYVSSELPGALGSPAERL
jgi:hypothetical protein